MLGFRATRTIGWLAAVVLLAPAMLQAKTFRELLDPYAGSWSGELRILTMSGREVSATRSMVQYWWDGNVMRGIAVHHDRGHLRHVKSVIYVSKGQLYTLMETGDGEKTVYLGQVDKERITWVPADPDKALREQMRERIYQDEEGWHLEYSGFAIEKINGREVQLIIKASLTRKGD